MFELCLLYGVQCSVVWWWHNWPRALLIYIYIAEYSYLKPRHALGPLPHTCKYTLLGVLSIVNVKKKKKEKRHGHGRSILLNSSADLNRDLLHSPWRGAHTWASWAISWIDEGHVFRTRLIVAQIIYIWSTAIVSGVLLALIVWIYKYTRDKDVIYNRFHIGYSVVTRPESTWRHLQPLLDRWWTTVRVWWFVYITRHHHHIHTKYFIILNALYRKQDKI